MAENCCADHLLAVLFFCCIHERSRIEQVEDLGAVVVRLLHQFRLEHWRNWCWRRVKVGHLGCSHRLRHWQGLAITLLLIVTILMGLMLVAILVMLSSGTLLLLGLLLLVASIGLTCRLWKLISRIERHASHDLLLGHLWLLLCLNNLTIWLMHLLCGWTEMSRRTVLGAIAIHGLLEATHTWQALLMLLTLLGVSRHLIEQHAKGSDQWKQILVAGLGGLRGTVSLIRTLVPLFFEILLTSFTGFTVVCGDRTATKLQVGAEFCFLSSFTVTETNKT